MANSDTFDVQPFNQDVHSWWQISRNNLRFFGLLVSIIALVLFFSNLTTYPQPWIDEGYLTATARTLATQGYYTPKVASNVPEFDPTISTGPTLIVPVAIAFKLFGVGLLQARIISVIAGLLTLIVIGLLAQRLVGKQAGLIMIVLLLAGTPDSFMSFVPMARQMIGEVSAIGLCLYGIWLWLRACESNQQVWWRFLIAGMSFGLALVTKPQMVMAIPPAFVLSLLAERVWYRVASWQAWLWSGLGMTLIVLSWIAFQSSVIGFDQLVDYYFQHQSGMSSEVMNTSIRYLRRAVGTLWRGGLVWWGLPGIIYALSLVRQRTMDGFSHAWVLLVWICWTLWMVLFSVGWSRYGFLAIILPLFWTSGLIYYLYKSWSGIPRLTLAILVGCGILFNGVSSITPIFSKQDQSAELFSTYLYEKIPHNSAILSWEWELDILAPQQFHYPSPTAWFEIVELVQSNSSIPQGFIDPSTETAADYIIDGPFSSWTTVFHDYIVNNTTRVTQIGPYTLYEVR